MRNGASERSLKSGIPWNKLSPSFPLTIGNKRDVQVSNNNNNKIGEREMRHVDLYTYVSPAKHSSITGNDDDDDDDDDEATGASEEEATTADIVFSGVCAPGPDPIHLLVKNPPWTAICCVGCPPSRHAPSVRRSVCFLYRLVPTNAAFSSLSVRMFSFRCCCFFSSVRFGNQIPDCSSR